LRHSNAGWIWSLAGVAPSSIGFWTKLTAGCRRRGTQSSSYGAWEVLAEVSFNHYGERGRVDSLAFHRALRILIVVEIKSELADVQGLLGPLDVKTRVASSIAVERGWGRPIHLVPVLVIRESATSRRRLVTLAPLFGRFNLRGRGAISWLRKPSESPSRLGLLILSDLSPAGSISAKRVGTQRVRVQGGRLSVADVDAKRDGSAGDA
jgi:hypothetical protein